MDLIAFGIVLNNDLCLHISELSSRVVTCVPSRLITLVMGEPCNTKDNQDGRSDPSYQTLYFRHSVAPLYCVGEGSSLAAQYGSEGEHCEAAQ